MPEPSLFKYSVYLVSVLQDKICSVYRGIRKHILDWLARLKELSCKGIVILHLEIPYIIEHICRIEWFFSNNHGALSNSADQSDQNQKKYVRYRNQSRIYRVFTILFTCTCTPCIVRSRMQPLITYSLTYHLQSMYSIVVLYILCWIQDGGSMPHLESGPPPAPSKRFCRRIPDKPWATLITGFDRIIQNWVGGSVAGEYESKCKERLYVRERSSDCRVSSWVDAP